MKRSRNRNLLIEIKTMRKEKTDRLNKKENANKKNILEQTSKQKSKQKQNRELNTPEKW